MKGLSIKDVDGNFKRFEVRDEVYLYVRQLETYILHPQESKLKEVYSERFPTPWETGEKI